MPNQKNVKKWVKALRSGKYQQCRRTLSDGERYCCLGVVCVLAGIKKQKVGSGYYFDEYGGNLPPTARQWLGIKVSDPLIGYTRATFLNDDKGLSFSQIADLIEKEGVSE